MRLLIADFCQHRESMDLDARGKCEWASKTHVDDGKQNFEANTDVDMAFVACASPLEAMQAPVYFVCRPLGRRRR